MQPGPVRPGRAADEQHPVADLALYGQGIGKSAQDQFARINRHAVARRRLGQFVEAVQEQEGAADRQVRRQQIAREVGDGAIDPRREHQFKIRALSDRPASAPVGTARKFPEWNNLPGL